MKTTVEIPDSLMREVKRYALDHRLSFRQVIENSLRQTLRAPRQRGSFRLKDGSVGGQGMQKDYDWGEIQELIYAHPLPRK